MTNTEKLQQIEVTLTALYIASRDIKNGMRFAPPELSKAIGSISEAGRHLKTTIAKLNVK